MQQISTGKKRENGAAAKAGDGECVCRYSVRREGRKCGQDVRRVKYSAIHRTNKTQLLHIDARGTDGAHLTATGAMFYISDLTACIANESFWPVS